jgi:S-DNA-T family DNA segregation ATPase FtsK/SpoIIIE
MRKNTVAGEQLAQVDNPDPFAPPVWRSPVYRTPEWVIGLVQLARLLSRLTWFICTHPRLDGAVALIVATWVYIGWPGLVWLATMAASLLIALRVARPDWFARFVAVPLRDRRAWWRYRRGWHAAMTLGGLAPLYAGRVLLPVLGKVRRDGAVDLVPVGLVTGQSPAGFADRADNLAHAFGALLCRVHAAGPGSVLLEFVRADTLAEPFGPLPLPADTKLSALPAGRCENGSPWLLRLLGTHVLIAGATGSGKGSVIWSVIRALIPGIAGGWVKVWALDPKRMELSYGRGLFDRYADQAAAMVELLEAAVTEMHDRAAQFGGRTRTFLPSAAYPFLVIVIDELAFITAYQPERDLRKRAEAALATLTSQGRSVGVCVVGALQDPRKDVISLRNLFPTRVALRLDESDQVDMVLGDGARDRGALADLISPLPQQGAGVGYVRLEGTPDPVRVRAAFVADEDIHAMVAAVTPLLATTGVDAR